MALADAPEASTRFYAQLYLGLLAEAQGDAAESRRWIDAACANPYGRSGDYMYSLAKTHRATRGGR